MYSSDPYPSEASRHHATRSYAPETLVVEAGRPARDDGAALNPPVVYTSTYVGSDRSGEDARGYARFSNPTWEALEEVLATLEGASEPGLVFGSGMAAVNAALELVAGGGTVIVPRHAYNGTLGRIEDLEAVGRVKVVRVDVADTAAVTAAIDTATGPSADADADPAAASGARPEVLLWIESPTNPMLEVADLPALVAHAREKGVRTVVDNTFATPLGQQPLAHGADVVVHSVTKSLAGHSDVLMGAVLTNDPGLHDLLAAQRTLSGAIPGPQEAYLALRGIRTLALRLERAQENAAIIAARLAEKYAELPEVGIRFPGLPADPGHARAKAQMTGFGTIIGVVLPDAQTAEAVVAAVELWTPATSLGGVESLLERRRRHAGEPDSVPEGLIRLSVGIEHVEDLWTDLVTALEFAGL